MSAPLLLVAAVCIVLSLLSALLVLSLWIGDKLQAIVDEWELRKEQQ